MIHMKTTCDKRRTKKDGTHAIVFRLTVNGEVRDVSSGLHCKTSDWNYRKNCIKEKTEQLKVLGRRIQDKELEILKKIREFEQEYPFVYDAQDVKDYLCNKKPKHYTVKDFWQDEIERMKKAQRHSNAVHHLHALQGMEKATSMEIPFEKINYSWLMDVETEMRSRGLKYTTISVYLRALRSVFNKAINHGTVEYSIYPFRRYKIKSGVTTPRSLTLEEMKKFFAYKPTCDKKKHAHDIGRLIFMFRGMNYTDLAKLTRDNLKNGRIVYHRSKTKKLYSINIHKVALRILDEYSTVGETLLLSLLSEAQYKQQERLPNIMKQKIKVLNKWLRKIGDELEVTESLSTYVFRFSHANICRQLGYSKDMISQSLGHVNPNGAAVTDRYLNDYDHALIDEMNDRAIEEVIKGE